MSEAVNTHDQLCRAKETGLPDVAILTRSINGGRSSWRDGWKAYRPGVNLGTETNHWDYDYGCRVFSEGRERPWREARKAALIEAMAWVSARYGVSKFARNRMGDYVDERVNKQFPLRKQQAAGGDRS